MNLITHRFYSGWPDSGRPLDARPSTVDGWPKGLGVDGRPYFPAGQMLVCSYALSYATQTLACIWSKPSPLTDSHRHLRSPRCSRLSSDDVGDISGTATRNSVTLLPVSEAHQS